MLSPRSFFDLDGLFEASLFEGLTYVWEALPRIKGFIEERIRPNVGTLRKHGEVLTRTYVLWRDQILTEDLFLVSGDVNKEQFKVLYKDTELEGATVLYPGVALMDDQIQLGPGVVVEPGALIKGPTIIGAHSEVRQGAYLRGSCLVGRKCVVGHVTEVKNSVMLDGAKAGHFAYLGDSILGRNVNLGAGTKLANLKIIPGPFRIDAAGRQCRVDFRKFGAILGDETETGCNTVTNPGTVMGKRCLVTPNMTVPSGYHSPKTVIRPPRVKG
jgi:acetyltransferase-like isoleucine patch superfamily enzyme